MTTSTSGVLDRAFTIVTPEQVEFEFPIAGLASRAIAWMIDTVISTALAAAAILATSLASSVVSGFASAAAAVIWFAIDWGYFILLEAFWSGRTVGKRVVGIRVMQDTGVQVTAWSAVIRNLVRLVDRLPIFYAIGGVTALIGSRHQRLGDIVAGTIVVVDRRPKIPSSLVSKGEIEASEGSVFAQLAVRLSREEEAMLYAACLRRGEMEERARLTLFARLATHLEQRLGRERPAHLSPEKYVLYVTSAIAHQTKAVGAFAANDRRRQK